MPYNLILLKRFFFGLMAMLTKNLNEGLHAGGRGRTKWHGLLTILLLILLVPFDFDRNDPISLFFLSYIMRRSYVDADVFG